ncbi:UNKNOWN [Stylonychia lemnae]|uniref:LITAF domain-containing protein n=1 Tax=Stylonychia lemnae TaxID=5949 RepID=A0A078BA05_STYLE|nr:UNKNOWN [Stylonychia lemnae]|eukprot:CDW91340.1 UNKNOWN [Stylonychia lemnae]
MSSGAPMPAIIYVGTNGEVAACPKCNQNVMIKTRKWSRFTSLMVCMACCCALFSDYSWEKEMQCLGCGHDEKV